MASRDQAPCVTRELAGFPSSTLKNTTRHLPLRYAFIHLVTQLGSNPDPATYWLRD